MKKIVTIENRKNEKFLRRQVAPFDFDKYTKKEINALIKEMKLNMEKADGVGLSANQIGLDMKVFVAKVENKFYTIFNPEIIKESKTNIRAEEGCLSIPNHYDAVTRPEKITLVGYDKNGKKLKIKAWGLLARVFQHEMDHLNGILFTDRTKEVNKILKITNS